jgi:hypothetical protein
MRASVRSNARVGIDVGDCCVLSRTVFCRLLNYSDINRLDIQFNIIQDGRDADLVPSHCLDRCKLCITCKGGSTSLRARTQKESVYANVCMCVSGLNRGHLDGPKHCMAWHDTHSGERGTSVFPFNFPIKFKSGEIKDHTPCNFNSDVKMLGEGCIQLIPIHQWAYV